MESSTQKKTAANMQRGWRPGKSNFNITPVDSGKTHSALTTWLSEQAEASVIPRERRAAEAAEETSFGQLSNRRQPGSQLIDSSPAPLSPPTLPMPPLSTDYNTGLNQREHAVRTGHPHECFFKSGERREGLGGRRGVKGQCHLESRPITRGLQA